MSLKISGNQLLGSQWCRWICELQRVNNYFTSISAQNHQNVSSLNLIYFQDDPDIAKVLMTDKRRGIWVMVYHIVFSTVFYAAVLLSFLFLLFLLLVLVFLLLFLWWWCFVFCCFYSRYQPEERKWWMTLVNCCFCCCFRCICCCFGFCCGLWFCCLCSRY